MSQQLTAGEEWKSHWPMVMAAMIGMSFYSVITYTLGVFIEPLEQEFGWSRTQISSGLTTWALITMLGSPFMGMLIDRLGARKIAIPGVLLTGLALSAFSLVNGSVVQWLGLWVLFGLCSLTIKSTIWSASVSSVFTTSRGLALAVALSGTAIGQSLSPIIANLLINSFGWSQAYIWLGFGWGGLALALVIFFFYDIRDVNKQAAITSQEPTPSKPVSLPGLTMKQAFRDSRIIRIAILNLVIPLVGSGVTVHMVPIISEAGVTREAAVGIAAAAGISGLAGKFVTGWLLDRYQGNSIPFLSFALAALGYFLLLGLLDSKLALLLGAITLGYTSGAGLQCTIYLISRYAGMKAFGTIYGTIGSLMMLGTAFGPTLVGTVYDLAQSYSPVLITAIPTILVVSLLLIGLGPYPDFKEEAEESGGTPEPANS